jgi:hypothetical protein
VTNTPKGRRRPVADDMAALFAFIAAGLSLRKACRKMGIDPSHTHTFIDSDADLRQHYARAREQRADHYAELGLKIGVGVFKGEGEPDRARVALDAIKWAVGRMAPKSGPVQRIAHSFDDMTPEERQARIVELQAEIARDGS